MDPRPLRALSRELVRELGMLSQQCGSLALSPLEAHLLIELENGPATNQQLAERLRIDKSNASRPLARLAERELIAWQPHPSDGRSKEASLTEPGKAQLEELHRQMDETMAGALAQLSPAECEQIWEGMRLYRSALSRARRQQGFVIRPITPADNPRIAAVVRAVSAEYGLTADKGYGVADPNLDFLHETYQGERSRYWVIEGPDGAILGGGGIADRVRDVDNLRARADGRVHRPGTDLGVAAHRVLGAERLTGDGGAQAVPRVGACEDGGGLTAVGLDFVGHGRFLPGSWG